MASQRVVPASYSKYAPLRYEVTRPYSTKLALRYKGMLSKRGVNERQVKRKMIPEIMRALFKHDRKLALLNHQMAFNEFDYMYSYGIFYGTGRLIYEFREELLLTLLSADTEDLSLCSLMRPADSFYLHFGDINWPSNVPNDIEGVYVQWGIDEDGTPLIYFDPVIKTKFSTPPHMKSLADRENLAFTLFIDNEKTTLADVCEEIAEEQEVERQLKNDDFYQEMIMAMEKVLGVERPDGESDKSAFVAKLSINCILYLLAVKDDVRECWDDRVPQNLKDALESEKEGKRKTAEKTLENMYLRVKYVGEKFSHSAGARNHESGRKISHIRNAHFRNQAYGPEWSLHRVIFIPPAVIHADEEIPGRIFKA